MKLEHKSDKLATFSKFISRIGKYSIFALGLVSLSLFIGTVGYYHFAKLAWIDSFYMSCMILTGMGQVNNLEGNVAKIFSSFYALYSGIAFLSITAVFFAPIIHRVLHILNIENIENDKNV